MKRKRFTEEQIIRVLKEHELGAKASDLCRKHGISEATRALEAPAPGPMMGERSAPPEAGSWHSNHSSGISRICASRYWSASAACAG
jgi:hypothetical protein